MARGMEIQFNWIFILIAGAVILAFFLGVYSKYKEMKNVEIADSALSNIRATLTSAQSSQDTAKIIDIPEVPLELKCFSNTCGESGCSSFLEFKRTGIRQDTEVDIVFAPDEIYSNKLLTWTLSWEAPFRVADFLYLSNPKVRYVLVYSEDVTGSKELALRINKTLSDNKFINVRVVPEAQAKLVKDENDYLVKFVFFFEPMSGNTVWIHPSLVSKKNWDVIFIYGDESKGSVKYSITENNMKRPDNSKEYPYLGTPMLIGAIFSESADFYACNLEKAYKRHEMVNLLYMKRTDLFHAAYAGNMECQHFYDQNTIDDFLKLQEHISARKVTEAAAVSERLAEVNGRVLYKDCPRLY